MKRSYIIITLLIVSSLVLNAQEINGKKPLKIEAPFKAQFLMSIDITSLYFHYVSGSIKYSQKNFSISVTCFPAFRYVFDKSKNEKLKAVPSFHPGLAVGPVLQYKKWLLGMPVFYSGAEAKWNLTVGVGYNF
jgi:hypothetical protein